jgi:hypothetical protein
MVPLSERRPRLKDEEIPEVVQGLKLRLMELVAKREEPEKTQIAYKCLTRLLGDKPGRPRYSDFSWDALSYYLDEGEDHINQGLYEMAYRPRGKINHE